MLSHLGSPPWGGPILSSFGAGYLGVTFFFVLSGFVLTHNYYERFSQGVSPRSCARSG
jgi:peptidoglycan/LPS O-acetylase OafA/YrhL